MTSTPTPGPVAACRLSEAQVVSYKTEGCAVLPGLVDRAYAAALREEVLSIMAAYGLDAQRLSRAQGTADKLRQTGQYLRGGKLDALVNSSALADLAGQLMEGSSTLYMPFTAVKAGGGGGQFHFHQDNQYTRFDGPGINLWFALNEMTEANGCLRIVPRSHLEGTYESTESGDGDGHRRMAADPTDSVPILMEPGDCVAFTRLTVHGSGPNQTSEPRVAYALQYHRNDVRATWGDDPAPRLLLGAARWSTGPVDRITPPDASGGDGH